MNNLTYTQRGDYMLPDLTVPESASRPIGKYGLLRKSYLKTHRKIIYTNLLTSGILHTHLAEVGVQANDRVETLVRQMVAAQGITETLKATDQMAWVGAMNNIRASAEEIVLGEIIYI